MAMNDPAVKTRPVVIEPAMTEVARYHPLLVALHWLLAVLILALIALGLYLIHVMPDADPSKIGVLRLHMAGGVVVLVLMMVRLVVRLVTAKPAAAMSGVRALDRLALLGHYAFYALVLLMVASGLVTATSSGLNLIVFGASSAPMPPNLAIYPAFVVHVVGVLLLASLIVLHVMAVAWHRFVGHDDVLGRMSFGDR
jgi:cytochrome b561